jgi:hypothetical protein
MCVNNKEKKEVNELARNVLDQRNWLVFIDKCISFENIELKVIENQLGLSGVQNEDNL